MITALPSIAQMVGLNRIVRGSAITSPTGDVSLAPADEVALRRRIVARAIEMLTVDLERGTVWDVGT
jgi:glycine reductase complex component B subunit gamma